MQKLSSFFLLLILLVGCNTSIKNKKAILCITSNQHTYGTTGLNAANHFGEIVLAYDVFIKAGYKVDFVSPKGGAIPIGYIKTSDAVQKKYLYNSSFMNLLKETFAPKDIEVSNYEAVYYSGGGSAMFGVAENKEIQNIVRKIYKKNGIIAAVCHGTAGLVNLKTGEGNYLYKGKKVTGYPDIFENKTAAYYQSFPFSIEETILKNGGDFSCSNKRNANFYVIDERFITGQDPSATISVAEKIIEVLENK